MSACKNFIIMICPYCRIYNKNLEKPILTLPDRLCILYKSKLNTTGKM